MKSGTIKKPKPVKSKYLGFLASCFWWSSPNWLSQRSQEDKDLNLRLNNLPITSSEKVLVSFGVICLGVNSCNNLWQGLQSSCTAFHPEWSTLLNPGSLGRCRQPQQPLLNVLHISQRSALPHPKEESFLPQAVHPSAAPMPRHSPGSPHHCLCLPWCPSPFIWQPSLLCNKHQGLLWKYSGFLFFLPYPSYAPLHMLVTHMDAALLESREH